MAPVLCFRAMPVRALAAAALSVAALLALPAHARAEAFLPAPGTVFAGVASGDSVTDFTARVGRRPAVVQNWAKWGGRFPWVFQRADAAHARTMLHISTAAGQNQPGVISPGQIARGEGDGYLLDLNRRLAAHGAPVYVRLMAEMNNCDLAYSSFDCSGRRRDADHSARAFVKAWRRTVLVVRGGDVATIDAGLRAMGLAPLRGATAATLPVPQVAFVWSPMTGGSPMIHALRPEVYWPGARWVDWVGTSFYSKFPNFRFLEPYYRHFAVRHHKPFAFSEWAMWGADDPGFVRDLFAWTRRHGRVRMMIYNQGSEPGGPFRLSGFPRAAAAIRRALRAPRYGATAPEWAAAGA